MNCSGRECKPPLRADLCTGWKQAVSIKIHPPLPWGCLWWEAWWAPEGVWVWWQWQKTVLAPATTSVCVHNRLVFCALFSLLGGICDSQKRAIIPNPEYLSPIPYTYSFILVPGFSDFGSPRRFVRPPYIYCNVVLRDADESQQEVNLMLKDHWS
jgi:hypothetical protein